MVKKYPDLKGKYPNGLAEAMKRADVGLTGLARAADENKQSIQRWRDGERRLQPEKAEKLAPHLGTTKERLLEDPTKRTKRTPVGAGHLVETGTLLTSRHVITQVPLLSWVSAGQLADPETQISAADAPTLPFGDLGRGEYFALKVQGDSMDRISPEDAIIVVDRADHRLVAGKPYVFSVRGETTFKLWQPGEPPYLQPYSWSPRHQPIFVKRKRDFEVIGRVRRSVLDL